VTRKNKIACAILPALLALPFIAAAQNPASEPPYIVEWVYKVKYGHQDEFWQIFRKYQIATLNREKDMGNIVKYEVFHPMLHTSEDHRWDYRIVIYYKNASMPSQASAIEKQLFPDQATMKKEENRRWEITDNHWDLPIREVDPNAPED
jgi:hypothetical protein